MLITLVFVSFPLDVVCNGQSSSLYESIKKQCYKLEQAVLSHLTKLSPIRGPMANNPGTAVH